MGMPTATVRMRGPDGISRVTSGIGSGPVDAAYKVHRFASCNLAWCSGLRGGACSSHLGSPAAVALSQHQRLSVFLFRLLAMDAGKHGSTRVLCNPFLSCPLSFPAGHRLPGARAGRAARLLGQLGHR